MLAAGSTPVEAEPTGAVDALAGGATETLGATLGTEGEAAAAMDGAVLAMLAAGLADPPQADARRAMASAATPAGARRDIRVEIGFMESVPS